MPRLGCLVLTALIACCAAPVPAPTANDAVVYVIGRDWHTDIGLPVDEIDLPLATLERAFPGVRFLTFGFGERQFLLDGRKDIGAMLAALLPSRSALLMTALSAPPEQAFGLRNVIAVRVPRADLDRIEAAIWAEFDRSPAGDPVRLKDGPYPGSAFYAARDTYFGLYTCNTWTADMMRAGGLPMPGVRPLFAGQVMAAAKWIARNQASAPSLVAGGEADRQAAGREPEER